jgi:hypothetical protein
MIARNHAGGNSLSTPLLMRRSAAARYVREQHGLPCQPSTLAKLASLGGGPTITYVSRYPLYSEAALDAWIQSRTFVARSTTERQAQLAGA